MKIGRLYILLVFTCLINAHFIHAQKLTAQVNKNKVQVGELFQLDYIVNTLNVANFKAPSLSDFDVYSGPNQGTSVQVINGKMSQQLSLTYYISAKKEGKFTIGPASINANGSKLESNSVTIEVKGSVQQQKQNNNQNNSNAYTQQNQQTQKPAQNEIATSASSDDLFVRTFVSKKNCVLGEQLLITHKIYSRLNLQGFQDFKIPSYNGFWYQEDKNHHKQLEKTVENLDGIQYEVVEFNKSYLFAQKTGKLVIDPIEIDCIVAKRTNRKPRNVFEQFFGTGAYENVLVKIKGQAVNVDVNPLPIEGKPSDFTGAVGNFTFKAELDKENIKANDAINLKVTVSGRGNIKIIDNPKIVLPDGFESYDPKIVENISVQAGVSGTKVYEYIIIPRREGDFKISAGPFSYYNPDKKQYVTVPSPEFSIKVSPGDKNQMASITLPSKTKIEEAPKDIRYINTGDLQLRKKENEFFGSAYHYLGLGAPLLLLFLLLLVRKKQQKRNNDLKLVKEKRASKLAKKHLQLAEKLKKQNKKDDFYHEVLIALNQYAGNKLNIPVSTLSKETITEQLQQRGVSKTLVEQLMSTLQVCEVAKYAPNHVSGDLNEVYVQTVELITKIEDEIIS